MICRATGRGVFNLIHTERVVKVDIIVRKDSEYRRGALERRRASVEDLGLSVAAPEDLIISKLHRARDTRSDVQMADVRNLLAAFSILAARIVAGAARRADRIGGARERIRGAWQPSGPTRAFTESRRFS